MQRRLAQACTRGIRQQSLVNELLAHPITYTINEYRHWSVGAHPVTYDSYRNLRNRLIGVGFVFKVDKIKNTITMTFPEED